MADPFALEARRRRVLAAWAASPARFREDANTEEDLVRGGYRDRLLVELAQNAADAAARTGAAGHLRLELTAGVLRAANTGAPLDAAGVEGLATLRASAKRDDAASVGRFGVGFAAVLAVTDAPEVVSTTGAVRFSADLTRAAVAALPGLAVELDRRGGEVPVLRLPFPAAGSPPEGFATEVVLPLRAGAVDRVQAALTALSAELLLALPGLAAIDVVLAGEPVRELRRAERSDGFVELDDAGRRTAWRTVRRSAELSAGQLGSLRVEERSRPSATVTWALPVDDDGAPLPLAGAQVVHAPTPSDEPLSLPARLIAPFPLGPDRRHVLPGPVTDALVALAADGYAELLAGSSGAAGVLALVPRVGLAGAELDADLGAAVLDRLTATAWLPAADPEQPPLLPGRAVALDDATDERVAALAGVLPGLLPADWSRRRDARARAALGVRRAGLADVVEAVRGVSRPPRWWAAFYAAFADADADELTALPVPLADGRTAHGPAGVLLTEPGLPAAALGAPGLRVAHPDAVAAPMARRLLERLGARPASAAAVLADDGVRAAVVDSLDAADDGEDVEPLATAVLTLVAAAPPLPGELPWLAELALPDADGGWAPAGELVLPGSAFAAVLRPGSLGVLDPAFADAADPAALRAVGVLDTFALARAEDPDQLDVDRAEEWADAVTDRLPADAPPPDWPAVVAVRDLDLVRDWPGALPLLAALPAEALADVRLGEHAVPGYLRWWLRTSPVLDGRRPDRLRAPDATALRGLYDVADVEGPVLELLAPPATVADVLADPDDAMDLLDRLGDPARRVSAGVLRTVYRELAEALDGIDVEPPDAVRVAPDRVVREAVVLDAPWLQPLVGGDLVPAGGAPGPVADLLDLPLASEVERASVTSRPARQLRWDEVPGAHVAAARLGLDELPGEVAVHVRLTVTGGRPVSWWPGGSGRPDVTDGTPAAFGRALAWRHGVWSARQALTEDFAAPDDAARLAAEDTLG